MDKTKKTVPESEQAEPETKPTPETPSESAVQPPEQPGTDEVAMLRADLARAHTERTAVLEAARMGIDAKHIDYVLKLADLPEDGKLEGIQKALQKVLDDVPAFRVTAPDNRPALRIGAKGQQKETCDNAVSKAFGNTTKN